MGRRPARGRPPGAVRGLSAPPPRRADASGDLGFNLAVHTVDAGFFGLALGLASFSSVVPLLLSRFTDSALILGLAGAMHLLGWHLPQLLTARRVAGLRRYMPMVMAMTTLERLPFFALAGLVMWAPWFRADAHPSPAGPIAAVLGLILLVGLGGGLTATPFQALVVKIIPFRRRTLFYGLKAASANLALAGGAEIAGRLLEGGAGPDRFALCFGMAGLATAVSWVFLALTREEESAAPETPATAPPPEPTRAQVRPLLAASPPFRWYLATRALSQLAHMPAAFYTVYALEGFHAGPLQVARLAAILAMSQVAANPVLAWAADRWGFRRPKALGLACAALGAIIAILTPRVEGLQLSMALAGVATVAIFTFPLAINAQFGDERSRPAYIGLSSTLTAPSILAAPLLGGWLADAFGFRAAFGLAIVGAAAAILALRRIRPG